MAKTQAKEVKKFEFSKVGSILDNIAKTVPIVIEKEITTSFGYWWLRLSSGFQ